MLGSPSIDKIAIGYMNIHAIHRYIGKFFRRKRMGEFARMFGIAGQTRILDIGGTLYNWSLIDVQVHLTIVNLSPPPAHLPDWVNWIVADACNLPFSDNTFDIVYSNSVIEHLFTREAQQQMAREVQRLAPKYYVQTPNSRFPVEPHYLTPFIHWLPVSLRKRMIRNFTLWGWIARPSRDTCVRRVEEIQLLNEKELRDLFPGATIQHERLAGLTKSLIAVKGASV